MNNASTPLVLILATAGWSLTAAQPDLSKLPAPAEQQGVTYAKDIRPLFEASCFNCHGERRQRAGLRLDSLEAALHGGDEGKVIAPGKSKESALVIAVAQLDDDTAMPPKRSRGGFGGFGGPGGPAGPGGPGGQGGPGGGRGAGAGGPGGPGGFGPGNLLAPVMFTQADTDKDNKVTKTEFSALADLWFDRFDSSKTVKLDEDQLADRLDEYLQMPAASGGGGGGGRGRGPGGQRGGNEGMGFSLAGIVVPGLFSAADTDKDKSLTRTELKGTFEKWFVAWDSENSGSLSDEKFAAGLSSSLPRPSFGGPGGGGRPGGPGGGGGFGGFGFGRGALAQQMLVQGDKDKDEKLSKTEFAALSEVWFTKLDSNKTGKVSQEQLVQKFGDLVGAPAGSGAGPGPGAEAGPGAGPRAGGPRGAGGFGPGQTMGPGLFTAADADKNGSVTRGEFTTTFEKWFVEWDAAKRGSLNEEQVADGLRAALPQGGFGGFGGGGPGGFGGGNAGPAPKPLTAVQVGLIRAWIDQGAK